MFADVSLDNQAFEKRVGGQQRGVYARMLVAAGLSVTCACRLTLLGRAS